MTTCPHGQSQRQCPLCERDETIAELRAENERLRDTIKRNNEEAECLHCGLNDCSTDHWERCKKHPARARVEALRAEVERLRPYEQAIREAHNGYDPEARAAMAPFLKEPATPKQAINELLEEAEAPVAKELAAAQQLVIDDEKMIQRMRARLAAAEKVVEAAEPFRMLNLRMATEKPSRLIPELEKAGAEITDALAAYDAATATTDSQARSGNQ